MKWGVVMNLDIIDRLLTYPQRGQVQINFDSKKGVFRLSIPIFSNVSGLPSEVKKYVQKRKGHTFKPHVTQFKMDQKKVYLVQEIPFTLEVQETLRGKADSFWKMSENCHRMFLEMAQEEKYKDALLNHDWPK